MESARADQSADRARLGGGENLLVYTAEPGSETAERLRLLAVVGARYVPRYGQPQGRVAKAVLVSAVPPLMVKTDGNPEGTDISVFDGFRQALAANRAEFFQAVASGPFYGFNRDGVTPSEPVIANWWRQGMTGSAVAHYEGIKAFSETDQTDDLRAITVPVLVLQGDDDQVVPYQDAALKQAELLSDSTLKIYEGYPHGMLTTHADVINPDILAFIRGLQSVTPW
jgi:non-heme chloroperoxidase